MWILPLDTWRGRRRRRGRRREAEGEKTLTHSLGRKGRRGTRKQILFYVKCISIKYKVLPAYDFSPTTTGGVALVCVQTAAGGLLKVTKARLISDCMVVIDLVKSVHASCYKNNNLWHLNMYYRDQVSLYLWQVWFFPLKVTTMLFMPEKIWCIPLHSLCQIQYADNTRMFS